MILVGLKDVEKNKTVGSFYCPSCCHTQIYSHVQIWKYITIYLLPVLKIKKGAEFLECKHCHNTFMIETIDRQEQGIDHEIEAEFKKVIKRILVLTILADNEIKPVELREASKLYLEATGDELKNTQIIIEKKKAESEKLSLDEYLKTARYLLNESSKEAIIIAACGIAACDGEFHNTEISFIKRCSVALGMTETHLLGIMQQCKLLPEDNNLN